MGSTSHVYQVFIHTTPEELWAALTRPEETAKYYYGTSLHADLRAGAPLTYTYPDGTLAADGKVLEVAPNRKLVMEFNPVWDDAVRPEAPVRMTWEILPAGEICKLVVTTDDLVPGSATESQFEGGVAYISSGLKSVLETGRGLPAPAG